METDTKKLHIKFDGPTMEAGRIDANDFAHTVSATAELLRFIAKDVDGAKNKSLSIDLVALKTGSFEVDLVVNLKDLALISPVLIPLFNINTISTVKQLIEILKSLIRVKKFLKGEKPTKVEVIQNDGSPHVAIHNNSGQINVNVITYNLLQSESTNKRLRKVFQPLLKEGSELESIAIAEEDTEPIQVAKEEAPYFEKDEELQMAEHKVKGIITAMDRKTYNGKISIGEKRINFEVEIADIKNLEKIVDGLIGSMKNKVAIMVIGEAAFDTELNIKRLKIKDIEKDQKLFE